MILSEYNKLIDRLYNNPDKKTLNFHADLGPRMYDESIPIEKRKEMLAQEINKALDQIERGEVERVENLDGDLETHEIKDLINEIS